MISGKKTVRFFFFSFSGYYQSLDDVWLDFEQASERFRIYRVKRP